jgi:hypothetical protein
MTPWQSRVRLLIAPIKPRGMPSSAPLIRLPFARTEEYQAMSDKEKEELEKVQAPTLQDLFEGVKGRRPKSLDELNEWLATDEGKEATIFESTSASRWGEVGRS